MPTVVLQPPALTNQYAAVPSLHSRLERADRARSLHRDIETFLVRLAAVLLPTAMLLAVVVTGNHFILDAILGVAVALCGPLGSAMWLNRRNERSPGSARRSRFVTDRPDERLPLAIAHRSGNHLERLQPAVAAGADLIEADVWLHRGKLEVRHLKTLGPDSHPLGSLEVGFRARPASVP